MNCPDCYTSPVNTPKITLPCQCIHCMSCLSSWIIERIDNVRKSSNPVQILCPNSECLKPFVLQSVIPLLREDLVKDIDQAFIARGFKPIVSPSQESYNINNTETEAPSSLKEKVIEMKASIIDTMYAACPICKKVTEKNLFCINKLCPKCEAKFCWVCKGSNQPYSYCVGKQCSQYRILRFVVQLIFLIAFFELSGILGYTFSSWLNTAHIAMAVCSLFVISRISFMTLFYHKSNLPDSSFLIAGFVISIFVLYGMPLRYLLELMMLKVGVNIILDWIFPPVVA